MKEGELREHLQGYYDEGVERDRLAQGRGLLEWARSTEVILRHLPAPPAVVADIGGGPGRYALWLAELGYRVEHRDLMPLHVQQLRDEATGIEGLHTAVCDARDLDLDDASVDAVLLLGPLYHLRERTDRIRALTDARRVVRPDGPVFVAAVRAGLRGSSTCVSNCIWIIRSFPSSPRSVERTGWLPPLTPASWTGYSHRPHQLRAELRDAGLAVADLVSVDGPAFLLADLAARWDDPVERAAIIDAARAFERVPELLGMGPHLLATARPQ